MNNAEIRQAASDAYVRGYGDTLMEFAERHERAIAAAVAAVAPLLLSAPSEEECDNLERKWGKAQPDFSYSIKLLMKDRLASVLAKPDPAIEAVREVVDRHFGTWCASVEQKRTDTVLAIVAAVDAARAQKP